MVVAESSLCLHGALHIFHWVCPPPLCRRFEIPCNICAAFAVVWESPICLLSTSDVTHAPDCCKDNLVTRCVGRGLACGMAGNRNIWHVMVMRFSSFAYRQQER